MSLLGTVSRRNISPAQAAAEWAAGYFPEPRKVAGLEGSWRGCDYRGTFRLEDGTRTYTLKGHGRQGVWDVYAEPITRTTLTGGTDR